MIFFFNTIFSPFLKFQTFMDVEPLIKVQENHVRRKPPLGTITNEKKIVQIHNIIFFSILKNS